jgi:hypothetical protein
MAEPDDDVACVWRATIGRASDKAKSVRSTMFLRLDREPNGD